MTRKLYSEERLVVRRLVKDEHRLMVYDAGASCGKPMDVGDAQCEMLTLWDKDRNYMRTKWNEAKNMAKEKEFSKNILCRIR